jgi:hypothetical protein
MSISNTHKLTFGRIHDLRSVFHYSIKGQRTSNPITLLKQFISLLAFVGFLTQHCEEVCAQPKLKIVEGRYWNWGDLKPTVLL